VQRVLRGWDRRRGEERGERHRGEKERERRGGEIGRW